MPTDVCVTGAAGSTQCAFVAVRQYWAIHWRVHQSPCQCHWVGESTKQHSVVQQHNNAATTRAVAAAVDSQFCYERKQSLRHTAICAVERAHRSVHCI